jgi:hypothetical protein
VAGKFGFYYVAKWTEFALTMATMRAAGVVFRDALKLLEFFPEVFPGKNGMTTHPVLPAADLQLS